MADACKIELELEKPKCHLPNPYAPPPPPEQQNEGKYRDRYASITPAGKTTTAGDSVANCMKPEPYPPLKDPVKKFHASRYPAYGEIRQPYGTAYDPQHEWARKMRHGVVDEKGARAAESLNPRPKTMYQQAILEKKNEIYPSNARAPLGKMSTMGPGLPDKIHPQYTTFGTATEYGHGGGILINPPKSYETVMKEASEGHDLYVRSHTAHWPGDQHRRNYDSGNFNRAERFGNPTPHDNTGLLTKDTMRWRTHPTVMKQTPITKARVDRFRERSQPVVGKVHDPIADTLNVAPNHTFGVLHKPDPWGVDDLIHDRGPKDFLRGRDRIRGIIASLRHHLKKVNFHNFDDLVSAMMYYDKENKGKIDIRDLREVCHQFHLPVIPELIEPLFDYCDVDKDGYINYKEFANFLNFKEAMPSGFLETPPERDFVVDKVAHQIDQAVTAQRTTSSMINGGNGVKTGGWRTYGLPSIRSDIALPRLRSCSDRTNYGDEPAAYALLFPNRYSNRGVYEMDFLQPRDRMEIYEIFQNIGLNMDIKDFNALFSIAQGRDPKGHVSIESFRNVLDRVQTRELNSIGFFDKQQYDCQGRAAGPALTS